MKTTVSHTYNKNVLNEAIGKVLTTPMKKDCEEEYRIVKAAGYAIAKYGRGEDGYFEIWNPENENKCVWLEYFYTWRKGAGYRLRTYVGKYDDHYTNKSYDQVKHIDFVAILDTPSNRLYREILEAKAHGKTYGQFYGKTALNKYHDFKIAKGNVKYAQENVEEQQEKIANLAKQIQELTAELPDLMAKVEERKMRLEKVRKEIGLA